MLCERPRLSFIPRLGELRETYVGFISFQIFFSRFMSGQMFPMSVVLGNQRNSIIAVYFDDLQRCRENG